MAFVWKIFSPDIPKNKIADTVNKEKSGNILLILVVPFIMLGIIMQGMLRDGVTTWMPTFISQTYNMSNIISISILSGVNLVFLAFLC